MFEVPLFWSFFRARKIKKNIKFHLSKARPPGAYCRKYTGSSLTILEGGLPAGGHYANLFASKRAMHGKDISYVHAIAN